jgi:hypothetical protein
MSEVNGTTLSSTAAISPTIVESKSQIPAFSLKQTVSCPRMWEGREERENGRKERRKDCELSQKVGRKRRKRRKKGRTEERKEGR